MSLQFSRSMRVLRLDSFRAARIGLLLAAVNMVILTLWFFFARVTLYEITSALQPGAEGRVLATFPQESIGRIRSGQSAWLRLDTGTDGPTARFPAMIYDVPVGGLQADVIILSDEYPSGPNADALSADRLKGQLEVEVEYVTPAQLVMRASGRFLSQNQTQISPQKPGGGD
jgi:hypothetical protein